MRFSESHEWVRKDERGSVVGITDHAQSELGEIVFIELPKVGDEIKAGDAVCVLESTKAAADIYTPVSGKILCVNEKLKENPSLINAKAEEGGWLFTIDMSDESEYEALLDASGYANQTT